MSRQALLVLSTAVLVAISTSSCCSSGCPKKPSAGTDGGYAGSVVITSVLGSDCPYVQALGDHEIVISLSNGSPQRSYWLTNQDLQSDGSYPVLFPTSGPVRVTVSIRDMSSPPDTTACCLNACGTVISGRPEWRGFVVESSPRTGSLGIIEVDLESCQC